jgi:hypothetical protein
MMQLSCGRADSSLMSDATRSDAGAGRLGGGAAQELDPNQVRWGRICWLFLGYLVLGDVSSTCRKLSHFGNGRFRGRSPSAALKGGFEAADMPTAFFFRGISRCAFVQPCFRVC